MSGTFATRLLHRCVLPLLCLASSALAAPTARVTVTQRGDFALIGNTLGFECAAGTPAPVVGTIAPGACDQPGYITDSSPDLYWRADQPATGMATANTSVVGKIGAAASSNAVLSLPSGARVTHAYLYWGATLLPNVSDPVVSLSRLRTFNADVTASSIYVDAFDNYLGVADVTALVQTHGSGVYSVTGVESYGVVNVNNYNLFAGWWMVVLYERTADPIRTLVVYDGLDLVFSGVDQTLAVSGFVVPPSGIRGRLGVVTFDGDATETGDQLFFNGGSPLSDALNPADNFFNSTRSTLGSPTSVVGDLPQLTGTAQSMAGLDLDVVDVTDRLTPGQTSAMVKASSSSDSFFLTTVVLGLNTQQPELRSTQSVVDSNGGAVLAGDVLQYEVVVINDGNDVAAGLTLTDVLPVGATYVPGSLTITQGPSGGSGQGEYVASTRELKVRLGTGANAQQGGQLAMGASTALTYQVQVDAGFVGVLSNQAVLTATGTVGGVAVTALSDGNGAVAGAPPTVVLVDGCESNASCSAPAPYCDGEPSPTRCVACLLDTHCARPATCDLESRTCVCVPTGAELCDGLDNDCNGVADDGNPEGGEACDSGLPGVCRAGVRTCQDGALACASTVAPGTRTEACNGLDDDCDGASDEDFELGSACSSGVGACASTGSTVCNAEGGVTCDAPVLTGTEEVCNGVDDDCDGDTDEGACGPDAGTGDAGGTDAGSTPGVAPGGCGCGAEGAGAPGLMGGLLAVLALARRRKPTR